MTWKERGNGRASEIKLRYGTKTKHNESGNAVLTAREGRPGGKRE